MKSLSNGESQFQLGIYACYVFFNSTRIYVGRHYQVNHDIIRKWNRAPHDLSGKNFVL